MDHRGVSGVMVSIVAFQAVDRGSIPCWRIYFIFWKKKFRQKIHFLKQKNLCQEWDLNPRPHLWTRILTVTVSLKFNDLSLAP